MAVIDYERAFLALKKVIVSKPSHGKRDLLSEIARIEIECEVPEGQEGFDAAPAREIHRSRPAEAAPELEPVHG